MMVYEAKALKITESASLLIKKIDFEDGATKTQFPLFYSPLAPCQPSEDLSKDRLPCMALVSGPADLKCCYACSLRIAAVAVFIPLFRL